MQQYIFGGYTKRTNPGVLTANFDTATAQFTPAQLVASLSQPTFLTLSCDGQWLFAIHKGEEKSGIVAFKRDTQESWQEVARCLNTDIPGCHVTYRDSSKTIYVSNYHERTFDVYTLVDDSHLVHSQRVQHSGSSIHPNQKSSHVHYTGLNSDNTQLLVCDLGTDTVHTYHLDEQGLATPTHEFRAPAGTGPRHLVLHPTLPIVYIVGELANTTLVATLSPSGELSLIQTLTNIPEEFSTTSAGAAIRLTADGRFLYVSTRFHNVITVYQVSQENGLLTPVQTVETRGDIPRDFILDQTEQYLLVPHQDSDYITVFRRDTNSGQLTFVHNNFNVPECVCIINA